MRFDAFQRALIRRRSAPSADELGGELNIVPFLDIVTNIIMFLLATTQVALTLGALDVHLGGHGDRTRPHALDLSMTVVPDGIVVATADGKLGPDCRHYAAGRVLTVRGRDWRSLASCIARVKAARPEETDVIVGADPQIAYEDVVHAMDAARPGFPHVALSAGVR